MTDKYHSYSENVLLLEEITIGVPLHMLYLKRTPQYDEFVRRNRDNNMIEKINDHYQRLANLFALDFGHKYVFDGKKWYAENDCLWRECPKEVVMQEMSKWTTKKEYFVKKKAMFDFVEQCRIVLFVENFADMLDSSTRYTPFSNCVRGDNGRVYPRNGYFLFSSQIQARFGPSRPQDRLRLNTILNTMFTDTSFLAVMRSLFARINHNRHFFVFSGKGSNGKSVMANYVQKIFGEFSASLPPSLITSKRNSGGQATPELLMVSKKKVVFIHEPESSETVQQGMVKKLSGNDIMYMRGLFSNSANFQCRAKFILVCNDPPDTKHFDAAARGRMFVIEFESKFVDAVVEPNEYPRDPLIQKKLWDLRDEFIALVFEQDEEYTMTESVRQNTLKFLCFHDVAYKFIQAYQVGPGSMMLDVLYGDFKTWHVTNYTKRIPNIDTFVALLIDEGYIIQQREIMNIVPLLTEIVF